MSHRFNRLPFRRWGRGGALRLPWGLVALQGHGTLPLQSGDGWFWAAVQGVLLSPGGWMGPKEAPVYSGTLRGTSGRRCRREGPSVGLAAAANPSVCGSKWADRRWYHDQANMVPTTSGTFRSSLRSNTIKLRAPRSLDPFRPATGLPGAATLTPSGRPAVEGVG